MRYFGIVAAFTCFAISMALTGAAQAQDKIVVRQLAAEDPGHAPIPIAILSPATGSQHRLIVISHGTGAGLMSHVDTAQALAEAGFVVAVPMHPGDNFQDDSAVGRPEWFASRSRHIAKVIDFMFAKWEGHARLTPNRVGIFGFSAGATTALVSIGGVPDLDRVPAHCASTPEFICKIMHPVAAGAPAPQWTQDSRIAAAVIAAPGLGFTFAPSGLAKVRVPVQLWAGAADQIVPGATNADVVRRLLGPTVDSHLVPGAGHLSFLAPCGPQTPPQLCEESAGFDRAAFHRELNQSVAAFFRKQLGE